MHVLARASFSMLLFSASACATIAGGSSRVLRLHTTPDYAKAIINSGKEYGASSTVELEGMGPYTIEFHKEGYYSQKVILDAEIVADAPPIEEDREKKVIAVMPIEVARSASVALSIAEGLTDQLRVSLAARGIRVIDRGEQERALKEIIDDARAASYDACTDENCQIPLGKALAASHILRTSLSRFRRMCAMTAELIALRESVTVKANTARGECNEEALLDAATELIAGI